MPQPGGISAYTGKLADKYTSMKQIGDFSPVGLRVLIVDDDRLCLKVLEGMLRQCSYEVTTCCKVSDAIALVQEKKNNFDLVMCEVYMPGEDGFELLEIVGLGLDLPVIMMSTNGDTSVVMKGITHGACDYLIKPIRMEALRNIWQHVLRRRRRNFRRRRRDVLKEETGECDDREAEDSPESSSRKKKDSAESSDEVIDDISSLKRARVHWTVQLHQQFVAAVNQLGVEKAVPKKIVEIMKVQGLSRENVASHLQKYRLYLKRLSGAVPEPYPVASFQAADESISGGRMEIHQRCKGTSSSAVKGLNLGPGGNSIQGLDQGTLKSLEQYRAYQQKLAANRAQVLGGLGISSTDNWSILHSLAERSKGSKSGLHRMSSLDLGLLWKAHRDQEEEQNRKHEISAVQNLPPKGPHTFKDDKTLDSAIDEKTTRPIPPKPQISNTFQSTNIGTAHKQPMAVRAQLKNVDELQPLEDIPWISDAFKPATPKLSGGATHNNLHRMSSIDLGLLWKLQQEQDTGGSIKHDTPAFGPLAHASAGIPAATPVANTEGDAGELQNLSDISWLDDSFKPASPRIAPTNASIFDNFANETGGSTLTDPNPNEANRQAFHTSEFGLCDISNYLMDDFGPSHSG